MTALHMSGCAAHASANILLPCPEVLEEQAAAAEEAEDPAQDLASQLQSSPIVSSLAGASLPACIRSLSTGMPVIMQ